VAWLNCAADIVVRNEKDLAVKYLVVLLAVAFLTACGTMGGSDAAPNSDNGQRPTMEQLGRMPLPVGTKLRTNESLIFGVGDGWLGRAVFESPSDATTTYNFFAEQMPRQGWSLISSVRGKRSLLVFTRGDRSAAIELDDASLFQGTCVVSMLISPVGGAAGAPASSGVVVQPIGSAAQRRP
jgi:hypothetical protein